MNLLRSFLLVLLFCPLALGSPNTPFQDAECLEILKVPQLNTAEIAVLQNWMRHHFRGYPSTFSMRFERANARAGDPRNRGSDVISFGSGPDVFTPLVNFPLARRVHLVDSWRGWGPGSGGVWRELILRIHSIHPSARLTLKEEGFVRSLPDWVRESVIGLVRDREFQVVPDFDVFKVSPNFELGDQRIGQNNDGPLQIVVEWESEVIGKVEHQIFVHLVHNFDLSSQLQDLNSHLVSSQLAGVIVEAAPFPKDLRSYIWQMGRYGIAVVETYSDNAEQLALVRELRKAKEFRVRLVHMKTYQRYGDIKPIEQKLYLIQRVK